MIRVLVILVLLVAIGGGAAYALTRPDPSPKYTLVFDNAFGLTPGVDLRVGGVRAGSVDNLDVERKTGRALITVKLSEPGISRFKSDARCVVRPQSLIGEYFVDCQPGQKGRPLGKKGRIPVAQTETTIPPDIVQNILTKPYRERLALIFNEFGGALAGRGPDLNETIRRAIPALNQTNRALKVLADNRAELQSLTRASGTVLSQLSDRRTEVTRFVDEAGDAAELSASRRTDLATTFRRFPDFLTEFRPTLRDLETAAREQTPALADLSAASGDLTTFFNRLGPFSEASRPALRSLGEASKPGIEASRAARPVVAQLRGLTRNSPELAKNLAIVLEHLDDRKFATEKNPLSPGGDGFTGLEALLQYPYVQSQAINIFDNRGYFLKLLIFANECSRYTNAESAKADPERRKRCAGILGPNQPGVTTPDPTKTAQARRSSTAGDGGDERERRGRERSEKGADDGDRPSSSGGGGGGQDAPSPSGTPSPTPGAPGGGALPEALDKLLPTPSVPGVPAPKGGGSGTDQGLLDFLLGP